MPVITGLTQPVHPAHPLQAAEAEQPNSAPPLASSSQVSLTSNGSSFEQTVVTLEAVIDQHVHDQAAKDSLLLWLKHVKNLSCDIQTQCTHALTPKKRNCANRAKKFGMIVFNTLITLLRTDGWDEIAGTIVFTDLKEQNFDQWFRLMLGKGSALAIFSALLLVGTWRAAREVQHGLPKQRQILGHPQAKKTDAAFAACECIGGILETLAMIGMAGGTACFAATTFIEATSAQAGTEAEFAAILKRIGISGSCMMLLAQCMMVFHAGFATAACVRSTWRSSRLLAATADLENSDEHVNTIQAFRNQAEMTRANACGNAFFRNLMIALGQSILFFTAYNHLNELMNESEEGDHDHHNQLPYILAGAVLSIGGVGYHLIGNEFLPLCCPRQAPENPHGGTRPLSCWQKFKSVFFPMENSQLREEIEELIRFQSAQDTRALMDQSQSGAQICQRAIAELTEQTVSYDPEQLAQAVVLNGESQPAASLLMSMFKQARTYFDTVVTAVTSNTDLHIARRELLGFIERRGIPIHRGHGHSHGGHGHSHGGHGHSHAGHAHGHRGHGHSHAGHAHGHRGHGHSHAGHAHGHRGHGHSHAGHGHGHGGHGHSHEEHGHSHRRHEHLHGGHGHSLSVQQIRLQNRARFFVNPYTDDFVEIPLDDRNTNV